MTPRSLSAPRVSYSHKSSSPLQRVSARLGGGLSALALSALAITPAYAEAPPKVMALHVEGPKVTPDLRSVLDDIIAGEFKRYPNLNFHPAPDIDMIELMLELECVDFDVECFSKLGARFQVDQVVHTEVSRQRRNDVVRMRVVDVNGKKASYDKSETAKSFELIPETIRSHILAAYGTPPVITTGTLVVEASAGSATIYLGQEFIGTGTAKVSLPEGEYLLRVTATGSEEVVRTVKISSGQVVTEKVSLTPLDVADSQRKLSDQDDSDTSWIVWTAVGVVVVAGAVTALLLATGSDSGPTGPAMIGVGSEQAWRDDLTLGGRR